VTAMAQIYAFVGMFLFWRSGRLVYLLFSVAAITVDSIWASYYVFPAWLGGLHDLEVAFDASLITLCYFGSVRQFFAPNTA